MHTQITTPIPDQLLEKACKQICQAENNTLPYKLRGITITRATIKAALEILNAHPQRTLLQNCRNDIRKRTPDGFDRRFKELLITDLRMANIISDVPAIAQIAEIVQVINLHTGKIVKGSRLMQEWCWGVHLPRDLMAISITSSSKPAGTTPTKADDKASFFPVMNKTQYLSTPVIKELSWLSLIKRQRPYHKASVRAGKRKVELILPTVPVGVNPDEIWQEVGEGEQCMIVCSG